MPRNLSSTIHEILEQHDALIAFAHERLRKLSKEINLELGKNAFDIAKQNWIAFYRAINWLEPFIISIIAFHLLCIVVIVKYRTIERVQCLMFICLSFLSFSLERMNKFLSKNWAQIGIGQNYFDHRGVFMSSMVSMPLIGCLIVVLVNFLRIVVREMVKAKRAQMKFRHRESNETSNAAKEKKQKKQ